MPTFHQWAFCSGGMGGHECHIMFIFVSSVQPLATIALVQGDEVRDSPNCYALVTPQTLNCSAPPPPTHILILHDIMLYSIQCTKWKGICVRRYVPVEWVSCCSSYFTIFAQNHNFDKVLLVKLAICHLQSKSTLSRCIYSMLPACLFFPQQAHSVLKEIRKLFSSQASVACSF